MEVQYLEHMGTDHSVVSAARRSFGKMWEPWREDKDPRLLSYLAKHKHEIPFAHPHVSFYFKVPVFVARQLCKHQIGFSWSETSRRYIKTEPEFYWPKVWRKGSPDIKQGSLDGGVEDQQGIMIDAVLAAKRTLQEYNHMLALGVGAEQARMILPQNMMVEFTWTGSLLGWARVWGLRMKPDAQRETREAVEKIGPKMEELFPYSWAALTKAGISEAPAV